MDEHAKKANQGKAPKGVSKKRKKPHKVQHSPWVGAGMGYAASRPTSHCNLCFDVLSADHTLEIAASALLSTTLGYCCGSPKFSCSAMQIFRPPDSIGCSADIALLPGPVVGLAVAFVCTCMHTFIWRYDHASMKPSNGHAFLVCVQELMQSTVLYGTHRHLFP